MFNKLYAICLLVQDFEKSFHFYHDILGLKAKSQEGNFADFKLGETGLAIFQKDDAVAMFPKEHMNTGGGIVLGFQVESLEKVIKDLKDKGVTFFEGPKKTPWGQKVACFKDPDGNVIELSEPFEE